MLNSEIAKNAAKLYLKKNYNSLDFNFYFVAVGETETHPTKIYAETFLNGLYANLEQVEELFFKKSTFKKEYLIKVSMKSDKKMNCEIIREPQ